VIFQRKKSESGRAQVLEALGEGVHHLRELVLLGLAHVRRQ